MEPLTVRQAETLRHIRESMATRGYPPTKRELCVLMGMKSTNAAACHLQALERKGYIRSNFAKARGIVPTDGGLVDLVKARQLASEIANDMPLTKRARYLMSDLLAALGIEAA